jgi:hypothetical protein
MYLMRALRLDTGQRRCLMYAALGLLENFLKVHFPHLLMKALPFDRVPLKAFGAGVRKEPAPVSSPSKQDPHARPY